MGMGVPVIGIVSESAVKFKPCSFLLRNLRKLSPIPKPKKTETFPDPKKPHIPSWNSLGSEYIALPVAPSTAFCAAS